MPRGGRPKPTALKIAEGNPGKRPLPKNEPKVPPGMPACPFDEGTLAYDEWQRVAPQLVATHGLATIHGGVLEGYCINYQRAVEADRRLAKEGMTAPAPRGGVRKHPCCTISAECWKLVRLFAGEFGLTPASQVRLDVSPGAGGHAGDLEEFAAERDAALPPRVENE